MLEDVIKNKTISIGAKTIYVYLELISPNKEVRDKSVRTIGEEVGVTYQTICRLLQELEGANLIERETIHHKKPQVIRLKGKGVRLTK